ncbi:23S rRNA (adenine(2030)-N(6))-methyltransferase RlmJ [Mesorhizobium sp. NBSH29]|uniref:23S rRNA (adenine(2030)-N(6))-methyltransferase RlmJ n=1 Tax=Mesorhizobium sp. NBSH29 TaxID=2654249 RepID=UPI001896881C|nr:23S rRNA (adenine(2030)-N(6))-methyltransferase RlmJ [Mesorhizobium sp. NBSH29]QPC87341.1 23S rRNA (adenine(2030)-N(6))-methyltransferase RlmJ [Mesorhizobium sp. NBSH29]
MNYRHAYHAGNFADVVKHIVLVRVVEYLKQKQKAFRVVDTHAGIGVYDLFANPALKTGEWRTGIGRMKDAKLDPKSMNLLKPFLDTVDAMNPDKALHFYPGSPAIVRHLMRTQDRLTAIELHPDDAKSLKARFAGDFQVRVLELDGWLALGGHLPPKEKRGLVVIDPPFELEGEFERMVEGLAKAHKRWPGGIYALWYPVKDRVAAERFRSALRQSGIPKILDIRFDIRIPSSEPRFDGTGMIVVNPPYSLAAELDILLPALKKVLAETPHAQWATEWLAGEVLVGDTQDEY